MMKVLLSFWFFASNVLTSTEARKFNPVCTKPKDIFIIVDLTINYDGNWAREQIEALVTSLLKDRCTTVWVYHNLRRQAIQLREQNWHNFMYSELDLLLSGLAADDDSIEILSKFNSSRKDKSTKVNVLYFYCRSKNAKDFIPTTYNFDLIFYCMCSPKRCAKAKEHLPRHRFIYDTEPYYSRFSQHLHEVLLGLLKNSNFDRYKMFDDFKKDLNGRQCHTKPLHIYFWTDKELWKIRDQTLMDVSRLIDFFQTKFPQTRFTQILEIESYFNSTFSHKYSLSVFKNFSDVLELSGISSKMLLERLNSSTEDIIHINIERKALFTSFKRDPKPFLTGQTIKVTVDDTVDKSPIATKDGGLAVWEKDLNSSAFFRILICKMNDMLCRF